MMRQRKGLIRTHKVISDYGIRDYYRHYKSQYKNTKHDLEYSQYSDILDDILKGVAEIIVTNQYDLKLPYSLGRIITRKFEPSVRKDTNGELYIKRGIDWKTTNQLWVDYPDLEKKQYVYYTNSHSSGYTFTIIYRKSGCLFRNRLYYTVQINRAIKRQMAKKIFDGEFDALETNTK